MTHFEFCLVSSLEKVLPTRRPTAKKNTVLRGFLGETQSIQIAYTCQDDLGGSDSRFTLVVHSAISKHIRLRKVGLVPCAYPCHGTWDDDYMDTKPGLYPDLLLPMEEEAPIKAIAAQWRSLWLDIDAPAGSYEVTLEFVDMNHQSLRSLPLSVAVLDRPLPKQTLIHTQWFHADCLADYYKVPVFSEEHWDSIDRFMKSAAEHGINMLLTPIYTPPLDTAINGERTTVQLIGVRKNGESYSFDFSKLERWIALCEKNGIEYLEIAHLFSQWGAVYAPKIMGSTDNGPEEKLFGWHTQATSEAYTQFLRCLLPELKEFLRCRGWLENTWFHISDEPHDGQITTYAAAKATVADLLADCKVMDALSSFEIYQKGLVTRPVVSVDRIEPFLKANVPHLWAYYCTAQSISVPNRFIAMPSTRNRILGVLLYYFNIEGFLQWGFNFYNSQRSVEHIDPFQVTDAGEAFPSGDPFLVYPAPDGGTYESIRGVVLKQALYDVRALQLLEQQIGREQVMGLIESHCANPLSFTDYPRTISFFEEMRESIHQLMMK